MTRTELRQLAATELLARSQARASVAKLYERLYPQFHLADFQRRVAAHLDQFIKGAVKRLVINIPPGHIKSFLASQVAPASYVGNFPDGQLIGGSYNTDLAKKFGREVRNIVASQDFHSCFENVTLRKDSKSAGRWNTNHGGSYIAAAVNKPVTGNRANRLIIDDPHADFATGNDPRQTERDWEWFKSLYTRLMPGSGIALVMQRMSKHDMTARCLKLGEEKGEPWLHINFPAIADQHGQPIRYDGTPEGLKELAAGTPLWHEFFTMDVLLDFASTLGPAKFNAMYQQLPDELAGQIIQSAWLRYWADHKTAAEGRVMLPRHFDQVIQSWDLKFSDQVTASWVVGQVWGFHGPDAFLLDQVRGQWGFNDTLSAILALTSRWPNARKKVIEKKANGPAAEQALRKKISGIELWEPGTKDKIARLRATEPEWSSGHVHLPPPEVHPFVVGYAQRLLAFPQEPNDEGDATSQALNWRNAKSRHVLEALSKE